MTCCGNLPARVSEIGALKVTEEFVIENYSHVMHIVSNVQGEVRDDVDALDVFKATLPAGTLSGAPKIRAMEIIDQVEPVKRGIFGGAVGYPHRLGSFQQSPRSPDSYRGLYLFPHGHRPF